MTQQDAKPNLLDYFTLWAVDFIEQFPQGIYRTTLEGTLLFCNLAFARILGFSDPRELTDFRVINLFVNKKDRGQFVRSIIEQGTVEEFPLLLKNRNGRIIKCLTSAKAVPDDDGIVVYFDGFIRESRVRTQEEQLPIDLSGLVDSMTLTLDLEGKIMDINQVGLSMLGYSRNELLGKELADFVLPHYRDEFDFLMYNIFESEKLEGILAVKDIREEIHQIEFQAALVKKDGKPQHILSQGRDITAKINLLKNRLAREKFQGVLEMAGGIAHNLNQPLMIINNLLQDILCKSGPENENHQKLERIHEQIMKLNAISRKIGAVKHYKVQDYVIGEKIVDINNIT